MMLELKVDLKNSILSLEKGRMVEYYTGFLFDFNSSDLRNNLNIAGGGRYDDLINSVSDENTETLWFGTLFDMMMEAVYENDVLFYL